MKKTKTILAIALLSCGFAASAQTVTVTGGPLVHAIGDEIGSPYDTFQFNSGSFTAQLGSFDVTSYDFIAGPNCYVCGQTTGSASFDLSYGGQSATVVVPFVWTGGTTDTISFASTTNDYVVNGQTYAFTTDAFSATSGGADIHGVLQGSVAAVPEPSTYALMLAGFAAIGFARRRNMKG